VARRREAPGLRGAVIASLTLHAGAVAFALAAPSGPREEPRVQVYRVDIVSEAPNLAGEPPAEPPATAEPEPAEETPAEPQPEPEAEPAPEPPPQPVPVPEPPRPAPPRPTPPREPARPQPPTPTPAPPRPTPPAPARTEGPGQRTTPATGRTPDPASRGGEGITVQSPGVACPSADYCNNVVRQVRRYFRPPDGTAGSRGDVCFRIRRDGSVADIEVRRLQGPVAFRFALMEAAEQAGNRRAFGALPSAFGSDALPVCVEMLPETL
jgi:outer membrane biosynthesis protein TonB